MSGTESEPESESEAESALESEPAPESESEAESALESESASEPESDAAPESASEPESEPVSEEAPEPASRPVPEQIPATASATAGVGTFFRSYSGRAWLTMLVLVPLLLGLIGYAMFQRARVENGGAPAPAEPVPTLSATAEATTTQRPPPPPELQLAALSIVRRGNEVTLVGDLPDPAAKRQLLDAVVTSIDDVNVIDNLNVVPGARALDFAGAAPFFDAATLIRDFTLNVDGDTVTLGGTAVKSADADAVGEAAEQAWPKVNIVNRLEISSLIVTTTPPR